jgi:diguanylate cyclase (GGDEF)-like protein/PAS domain S-box-containing protein
MGVSRLPSGSDYRATPLVLISTQRRILGAFAMAVAASVVITLASSYSFQRLQENSQWVAHTHQVIEALQSVSSAVLDIDASSRGYALSGDTELLRRFDVAEREVRKRLSSVRSLTLDNSTQQGRVKALEHSLDQRTASAEEFISARRVRASSASPELVSSGEGPRLQQAILNLIEEMTRAEMSLLTERQARTAVSMQRMTLALGAGNLVTLIAAISAAFLIKRDFAGARRAAVALSQANATLGAAVAARTAELSQANERLTKSCRELRMLVEQAPLSIAMFDPAMRYLAVSRRWLAEYGRGFSSLEGLCHYEVHPDLPQWWLDVHRRALTGDVVKNGEDLWTQADGSRHWLNWAVSPWRDERGEIGGIIVYAEDVTPRKHAEERLRLADAVFMSAQEGVLIFDAHHVIVATNPAVCTISEYSEAELVGQPIRMLFSDRHERAFYEDIEACLRTTGRWQGEIWGRRKKGDTCAQWVSITTVNDEAGKPGYHAALITDMSRMNLAESHLQYLAQHDCLTGLPNRSLLYLRLRHSLERALRAGTSCAVLFLDLDGFKAVNDTLGHEAGDELLRIAAERMTLRLRESDTLSRVGGDEFVVVLEQVTTPADVGAVAEHLMQELTIPFKLRSACDVRVGVSIGISVSAHDATDPDTLIRHADAALYQAKSAGRGTSRFYAPDDGVERAPGRAQAAQRPLEAQCPTRSATARAD